MTPEEHRRGRINLIRILRELAAQRPGPEGDKIRAEIEKQRALLTKQEGT